MKIIDAIWYTPAVSLPIAIIADICIGIVAVQINDEGDWKCYIGYGSGKDEDADKQQVAAHGMPLASKDAAVGFFPQADPERYKY
jgi:hypothetical protein